MCKMTPEAMTPIPSHAGDSKGACAAALRPASTGLHRRKQERLLPCQQDRGGVAPVLPAPCRTGLARLWRSIAIHGEAATYAQRHSRPSCVEIKLQAEMAEGRKAAVKAAELQLWVETSSSRRAGAVCQDQGLRPARPVTQRGTRRRWHSGVDVLADAARMRRILNAPASSAHAWSPWHHALASSASQRSRGPVDSACPEFSLAMGSPAWLRQKPGARPSIPLEGQFRERHCSQCQRRQRQTAAFGDRADITHSNADNALQGID
jgi:hypothetical protein